MRYDLRGVVTGTVHQGPTPNFRSVVFEKHLPVWLVHWRKLDMVPALVVLETDLCLSLVQSLLPEECLVMVRDQLRVNCPPISVHVCLVDGKLTPATLQFCSDSAITLCIGWWIRMRK